MVRRDKINKAALFEAAKKADIPQVSGSGSGKYSISVVNSDGNGKRISLSKALVEKLGLTDSVSLLPIKENGILMVAKKLPFERASDITLNSKDKRTAYNAEAVQLITATFGLDYSSKTSYSFNDIEFMDEDGMEIAAVYMSVPVTDSKAESA